MAPLLQNLERIRNLQMAPEALAAPGTAVNPTHRIQAFNISKLMADIQTTEEPSQGVWPTTLQTTDSDSSSGTFEMPSPDFNAIHLIGAGTMIGDDGTGTNTPIAPTAVGAAGAQDWNFYMDPFASNVTQTYTLEAGWAIDDSGVQVPNLAFVDHDLALSISGKKTTGKLTANWTGGKLRHTADGDTPAYTAIQAGLPLITAGKQAMNGKNWCIYASTTSRDDLNATPGDFSASAAARRLQMAFAANWKVGERRSDVYAIRCDLNGSPVGSTEDMGTSAGMFEHEATDAVIAYLQKVRGIVPERRFWLRIENIGPQIGAGPETYRFFVDMCVFLKPKEEGNNQKLITAKYDLVYALDEDFGGAGVPGFLNMRVRNEMTALLA